MEQSAGSNTSTDRLAPSPMLAEESQGTIPERWGRSNSCAGCDDRVGATKATATASTCSTRGWRRGGIANSCYRRRCRCSCAEALAPSESSPRGSDGHLVPAGAFSVSPSMAFSPDGTQLAFITRSQLYLRNLNSLEVKVLGPAGSYPFFSSDGKWIGFFLDGRMKKIPVTGGASQSISDTSITGPGASWGADDIIYYPATGIAGLSKIPASGGTSQPVTTLERDKGEISHRWPQILPGGKAVLFTVWTGPGADERHTHLQVLETGERRVIAQGAEMGRYVPSGHIVYFQSGKLTAIPFDLATLKTTGSPMPLPEAVRKGSEGPPFATKTKPCRAATAASS